MLTLPELGAIDWRKLIPLAKYQDPRLREPTPGKTSVTWHYNGPPIAGVENWTEERLLRFVRDVDQPNHIARIGMDGLAYHLIAGPKGLYQGRDLDRHLWHCANNLGNKYSISLHFPIGGKQHPTDRMLYIAETATDQLIRAFGMKGRNMVFGHNEWAGASTLCPGDPLENELRQWRRQNMPPVVTVGAIPFKGKPTLSLTAFKRILWNGVNMDNPSRKTAYSPAFVEADDIWNILVANNFNPAVWLAFFRHESQLGNLGVTAKYNTKNAGNVRSTVNNEGVRAIIEAQDANGKSKGPFVAYWTWAAGAKDWVARIEIKYIKERGADTIQKAIPIYAPGSDGNVPARYIKAIEDDVKNWSYSTENLVFRVVNGINGLFVRTGRGISYPKAKDAFGKDLFLEPGFQFEAQGVEAGEDVGGENRWAHMVSGQGFVSLKYLERV